MCTLYLYIKSNHILILSIFLVFILTNIATWLKNMCRLISKLGIGIMLYYIPVYNFLSTRFFLFSCNILQHKNKKYLQY